VTCNVLHLGRGAVSAKIKEGHHPKAALILFQLRQWLKTGIQPNWKTVFGGVRMKSILNADGRTSTPKSIGFSGGGNTRNHPCGGYCAI
jgi:hypothetical protein